MPVAIHDPLLGDELLRMLAAYGVDTVFGMPGVHNFGLYRSLGVCGVRHVSARHEQGAGFMADGYARAGNRPGVSLTISGPGVTNSATAVAQAWSDSVPVLVLSSALEQRYLSMEYGRVHEMPDQVGILAGITARAQLANHPSQAVDMLHRVFSGFATERPRPAHLSVPRDLLDAPVHCDRPSPLNIPPRPVPPDAAVARAANLLCSAQRPVFIAGGGAVGAAVPLLRLAETLGAAVITTVAGKGVVADGHRLSLGASLQRPAAQAFLRSADVVLAVGTELAEPDFYITAGAETSAGEVAEQPAHLPLDGSIIRIDIDPLMTTRHYQPAVPLWGDACLTLSKLLDQLELNGRANVEAGYGMEIGAVRREAMAPATDCERVHAGVLRAIRCGLSADGIVVGDMTQLAYSGCALFECSRPGSWLFPNGFGTLGYALPAAIGAALAQPGSPVVAIAGDCGFLFTVAELATAVELQLPLAIVLWDNAALGEIRDGMLLRGIEPAGVYPHNPDFELLAKSFGCHAVAPASVEELTVAVTAAGQANRPTLIHLREEAVARWFS